MIGSSEHYGFNTELYVEVQVNHIKQKISGYTGGPTYIEFGGKPFGDYHASRVMPGYNPDCKARMLNELGILASVVMVVNARDILPEPTGRYPHGRIRGDTSLRYGDETIRLIEEAKGFGIPIDKVVLSVTPRTLSEEDIAIIDVFQQSLSRRGIRLYRHFEIPNYPDPKVLTQRRRIFADNDVIAKPGEHLVIFSPGGGSGKFGVILSELYHALQRKEVPNFLKFETFPVFRLPESHSLNLAFEAATADLQNKVVGLSQGITTYDKDIENFQLLQRLYRLYRIGKTHPITNMVNPTDMGVNVVDQGIYNMQRIVEACGTEIVRRYTRYVLEYIAGDEKLDTVERAKEILRQYTIQYPSILPPAILPF